ncbi:MAG: hypothetical protein ABIO63_00150 [Casimicrobiaceae bacterium]
MLALADTGEVQFQRTALGGTHRAALARTATGAAVEGVMANRWKSGHSDRKAMRPQSLRL